MIRQQFDDIAQGGTGYQGYRRVVSNIAKATWDWQVDVPYPTGRSGAGRLPIRCRRGLLEGDVVEMEEPFLWVFDCRRGGTGGEDAPWTELQYGNVMKQVKRWMEGIHRWNAIFLLPAGLFFEESMRTSFGIRAECTLLRGV
jgi:hypothetical protein